MKKYKITLAETKIIMLDILIYLKQFCDGNELKLWLFAGTLLGAVRHKGYIPWDDDIDVCMPRSDYNKLLSLSNKIDNKYILFDHTINKKYRYPFGKLTLKDSLCVEFNNPKFCGTKIGIYIDIFPVDYIGDNEKEYTINCEKALAQVHESMNYLKFPIKANFFIKFLKKIKRRIIYNSHKCNKFLDCFNESLQNYSRATKYSAIPSWLNSINTVLETSEYDENIEIEFEGLKFNTYNGYIHSLEKIFGNYMELPPIEQREAHGFDAYLFKK